MTPLLRSLLEFIVVVGIVGLIAWGLEQFIPEPYKKAIRVVAIVVIGLVALLFIAGLLGLNPLGLSSTR